ncbi:MAG TPA: hypothetical protein VFM50_13245 [Nocardioidaceae bacterium]|nr:hypothetical protein [Nocardioidaceae bacterium]
MTRTVLVHVGAPKTGTSFVQDVLFQHRDELASRGILYPADRFDEHFLAALDLMELPWGGLEKEAVGAWDRLAEKVRAWDGTVIVSHEILATATRPQVRRALESFGEDAEVHVVLSARDLVRQIPAEWQENVKHRRVIGYRDFLDQITDPSRQGRLASWFWGVQEVPDILDRWGGKLPPERVHLVTVPKPGAPRTLLWERFASVLGIDPAEFSPESNRANPSLGVPESALVRRINERVNHGVLVNHRYRELVRELLVHRSLSHRRDGARLTLPPDVRAWAVQLSERWIDELARRGYDVIGSLDELRPDALPEGDAQAPSYADPDHPDEEQVRAAALDSIVALLVEASRLRDVEDGLREELAQAHRERDEAWAAANRRLVYRTKQRLVRAADGSAAGRRLHQVYRRVRGRSSRSA